MLNALFDGLLLVLDPCTEDILVSIGDKGFNVFLESNPASAIMIGLGKPNFACARFSRGMKVFFSDKSPSKISLDL